MKGGIKYVSRRIRVFFFFNDTATTEIYTLSLHDALPICGCNFESTINDQLFTFTYVFLFGGRVQLKLHFFARSEEHTSELQSHVRISYAVFCLKKKKIIVTVGALQFDVIQYRLKTDYGASCSY